jgi:hypothetical protein
MIKMMTSRKTLPSPQKVAALLLAAAALAILSMAFPLLPARSDFMAFYWAGTMVREGRGASLYDLTFGQGYFTRPYCHPPYEALIFAPLSYLPPQGAFRVWFAIQMLAFCCSLYLLREHMADSDWTHKLALGAAVFCPFMWALVAGQDCTVLLLLYVLVFRSLKEGREFRAGVWLGLGLFRFQLLLPTLLVVLVKRRRELLRGLVLTAAALTAISFALVGPHLPARYAAILSLMADKDDPPLLRWMPTLRGLTALAHLPNSVTLLLTLAVLSSLAIAWIRTDWDPRSRRFETMFALTVIIATLVSYHSFLYDLVILVLPTVLILRHSSWLTTAVVASYLPLSFGLWRSGNFGFLALATALLAATARPPRDQSTSVSGCQNPATGARAD